MIIYALQPRENVRKLSNQLRREVLIEQYSHRSATAVGGVSDVRSEGIHGGKVFFLEAWMFLQDLFLSHSMGQPAENVIYGNPHPANAWFAIALISLDSDARVRGRHASIIAQT
jgi:hypothetical protein